MNATLLAVNDLKVWFQISKGVFANVFSRKRTFVRAVDGISFDVKKGEIFCLAGESGCGKTTTARAILRLIEPTSGRIIFDGHETLALRGGELKRMRREMQAIFQDPYESLNPRMTIFDTMAEPINVHGMANSEQEKRAKIAEALASVGLDPPQNFYDRYPHQLSGGQRQRVAIASALILRPHFVVADEPVSMLDVSIRAEILKLMLELRGALDLTYLFITHDLAIARYISDRIAVMYLGAVMETGASKKVIGEPRHPYTKALVSVVPVPNPKMKGRQKKIIRGETPNPVNLPRGCRFRERCPEAIDICGKEEPPLIHTENDHLVACHLVS